jgi:hypothetical protein
VKFAALFCFSLLLISACDTSAPTAAPESMYADIIFRSRQCRAVTPEPSLEVVHSQQQLDLLVQELDRQTLGANPASYQVDFNSLNVLVLELGYWPTAGYSFSINDTAIRVEDNEAFLVVQWDEPPGDNMQAQVTINPCVIFTLPKGAYSRVTVDFRNKNNRLSVSLNQPP